MALFDLLGRIWAMGTLWQLSDRGPASFRQLQQRCENVSPTVLSTRLKELRAAGLVDHQPNGYRVTPLGEQLFEHLKPLAAWADEWAHEVRD